LENVLATVCDIGALITQEPGIHGGRPAQFRTLRRRWFVKTLSRSAAASVLAVCWAAEDRSTSWVASKRF